MEQSNASSNTLITQLKRKADGKTQVTMLEELNKVAMDIIGKVSFRNNCYLTKREATVGVTYLTIYECTCTFCRAVASLS